MWLDYVLPAVIGIGLGYLILSKKNVDYSGVRRISLNDFIMNMRKGQLIDIRKKADFETEKIKGARNFSKGYLKGKATKLRHDLPVFIYCDNGHASNRVGRKMAKNGFRNVYILEGGFKAYKESNTK